MSRCSVASWHCLAFQARQGRHAMAATSSESVHTQGTMKVRSTLSLKWLVTKTLFGSVQAKKDRLKHKREWAAKAAVYWLKLEHRNLGSKIRMRETLAAFSQCAPDLDRHAVHNALRAVKRNGNTDAVKELPLQLPETAAEPEQLQRPLDFGQAVAELKLNGISMREAARRCGWTPNKFRRHVNNKPKYGYARNE